MQRLYDIHVKILELLKQHPEGISEGAMRAQLDIPVDKQVQFGRRRRELSALYEIETRRVGAEFVYVYIGERKQPLDNKPINRRLQALVLHAANGRCGMCGKSIEKHSIALVVDHRIPRNWGGKTEAENLWALCEGCNHGKKNLFASMDTPAVREAVGHKSVHMRIGELLKAMGVGKPVPSSLIEFVARDQEDWHKRLRELRYLGWVISSSRSKSKDGRVRSSYTLIKHTPWPKNPTKWIREFEKERERRNKAD